MKISDVELNIDLNSTTYSVRVTRKNKEVKLWFTIENQYNDLLSTKNDAALVGLLIPGISTKRGISTA